MYPPSVYIHLGTMRLQVIVASLEARPYISLKIYLPISHIYQIQLPNEPSIHSVKCIPENVFCS